MLSIKESRRVPDDDRMQSMKRPMSRRASLARSALVGLFGLTLVLGVAFFYSNGRSSANRENAQKTLREAHSLYESGQTGEAQEVLLRSIDQDRSWAEPHYSLSKLLERSGHIAEAREHAIAAYRLAPADTEIALTALRLDSLAPREGASRTLASEVVERMPDSARARLYLGRAITDQDQKESYPAAAREFQEALRIDPSLLEAHVELGLLYQRMNRDALAATELETAGRALDAKCNSAPLPVSELGTLNAWLLERRRVAFALSQVELLLHNTNSSRDQAKIAAKASACVDRLKSLVSRATMKPPDRGARQEIVRLCEGGIALFTP